MTELKPVHPEEGSCPSRRTHDLARLQQSFDEEAAGLRVRTLNLRRRHIGSFAPTEPDQVVLRRIIRESRGALWALAIAALGHVALYLVLPA